VKSQLREAVSKELKQGESQRDSYEQVLMAGLKKLDEMERKALFLRFWVPCSVGQIAIELKINWDLADHLINRSIAKLREHFTQSDLNSSPFRR